MTRIIFIYFSNEKNLSQQIGLMQIFLQKKNLTTCVKLKDKIFHYKHLDELC